MVSNMVNFQWREFFAGGFAEILALRLRKFAKLKTIARLISPATSGALALPPPEPPQF
jgi:TolB-like protein